MKHQILGSLVLALPLVLGVACGPAPGEVVHPGAGPRQSVYVDDDDMTDGSTAIDQRDLEQAADKIVRGLLSQPKIAGRTTPPRLIIDAHYWINESSVPFNLNKLGDDIRISVISRAEGRVAVVNREAAAMVETEKVLKDDGAISAGTNERTAHTAGADYRLKLRITSHEGQSRTTGELDRAYQFAFELIDLETSISVWADLHKFRKRGGDDVVYH